MQIQETYNFSAKDYNEEAFDVTTGEFFLELISRFENHFHDNHPFCYANYLFANSSTMFLFNRALDLAPDELSGMDMIDGKIDIEVNLEIEKFSKTKTIYAIGSNIKENEEEPLFLVINDKLTDGTIILKYIPDNDSEGNNNELINDPLITEKDHSGYK
jgi:hypothetical protein